MRILSGIQPSGTLHLGNYFGMMKPSIELQHKGEALYFIADLHALTLVTRNLRDFDGCGVPLLDPFSAA